MNPNVWIVVVNYRTADLAIRCLESLANERDALASSQVLVIDNFSGDNSMADISAAICDNGWTDWAAVHALDRNGGYSFGINRGIEQLQAANSEPEFFLILNPDTQVERGSIVKLVEFMKWNPEVGVAGARISSLEGRDESAAHRFPSMLTEFLGAARSSILNRIFEAFTISVPPGSGTLRCDWISGACMMIRSRAFASLGGFDEGFFLYFEEVDFCRRAAKAGWQTWYLEEAHILHHQGASTKIDTLPRRPAYWYESRRRYFIKHHGKLYLFAIDLLWLMGRGLWHLKRVFFPHKCRDSKDPDKYLTDLIVGDLRALLSIGGAR